MVEELTHRAGEADEGEQERAWCRRSHVSVGMQVCGGDDSSLRTGCAASCDREAPDRVVEPCKTSVTTR